MKPDEPKNQPRSFKDVLDQFCSDHRRMVPDMDRVMDEQLRRGFEEREQPDNFTTGAMK